MPLIPDSQIDRLRRFFADTLEAPVQIRPLYTSDPDAPPEVLQQCQEAEALLRELGSLSELLSIEPITQERGVDEAWRPQLILNSAVGGELRYVGLPAGNEFPNFIRLVEMISSRDSSLRPETRRSLARVSAPVHVRVFVTPT